MRRAVLYAFSLAAAAWFLFSPRNLRAQTETSLEGVPPVENVQQAVYFLNLQRSLEQSYMTALFADYQRLREEQAGLMQQIQALHYDADAALASQTDPERESEVTGAVGRLEEAEARLKRLVDDLQRMRQQMTETRRRIMQFDFKIAQVRSETPRMATDLTGVWLVSIQPMGLAGEMRLFQNGVLLSGSYRFSGGWRGNVTGFVAGDKIILDRFDAEKGHAGQFTAAIADNGNSLAGRWTSFDVTAGQNLGAFRATRLRGQ